MNKKSKAIFLDRDGVINQENNFISSPEELILYDYTASAIKKINQSDYFAIVVTNQSGVARNYYTLDTLNEIHDKLKTELSKGDAYLDAIYFCPHHPDTTNKAGNPIYQKICVCRKPKSGMLYNAAKDFRINLSQSFIIGDAERDIICGENAGVKTIGVKTGKGMSSSKAIPDYLFNNLMEAVDFILSNP